MSRPKSRNVLLSGNALSGATTASSKDELLAMKYVMEKPADHIYALDEKLPHKTYPDYNPWAESDRTNPKLITTECLNNGYFEPPSVANEYFSARNLIQETLLSSESGGKSLLQELSLNLTRAYKVRNEVINKITSASHTFRLPPRVTLTASKRDAWLRDLANAEVPLSCVSSKIPHGIRNKVLIDHMCTLKVPVSRALWFVKCVLCSEQMLLRKKFHSRQSSVGLSAVAPAFPSLDFIEGRWLQEWTSQVADYVLKFSREMPSVSSPEKRAAYSAKLAYLLRLIQTLYIELLLDRTYFLSCVVRFLVDESPVVQEHLPALLEIAKSDPEEGSPVLTRLLSEHPLNYGQLLSALTLVRTFWHEILHHDFLCKQLGEMLLLNFFLVERVPIASVGAPTGRGSAFALPLSLKEKLLALISASVVGLFLHNSNAFIVPDSWLLTGSVLYRILAQSDIVNKPQNHKNFEDIFRLINFRNESLMLNMRYTVKDKLGSGVSSSAKAQGFPPSTTPDMSQTLPSLSRSSEDTLMFIDQLDAMNLRSSLALSLRPTSSSSTNQDKWRTNVRILVKWCTSAYRDMGTSCEKVLILCNFVKKKVLQPMTTRGSSHLKAEFESEILESIFSLAEESLENLSMHNLFVLINEFYQLKIISISSYLRKIIACGIFYISSSQSEMENENPKDPLISFHLAILSNLPALNNKQHYQILSKWTPDAEKLSLSFDRGMEISKTFMLKSLVADSFPEEFKDYLQEIRSFSVGVKFLLVNWLTSQIKTTITQSPKLIHISPSTIARIYEFYSVTDNLTVFFRVFIRFVLKNEDKVIIYYLDTLDYIGKLLQHHYLLVNFLPGNNIDRVSAAYELYNLIISAYHDLSSREPDLYNFKPLWEFMNQSVDKKITDVVSNNTLKSHDPELDKYIFSKESAESPLKVQVPTPRRNQVYSAEQFVENLNQLLYRDLSTVSAEDVSDFFQEIGSSDLDFSMDAFSNEAQLPAILEKILDSWKTASSTSNERQDCAYSKLVKFTTSLMKGTRGVQATVASITNTFQRPFYEEGLKSFLIKIISYRILSFADVITVLKTVAEKPPNVSVSKMIISLVFGPEESVANLAKSQEIMFNVLQTEYKTERIDEALHLCN
ncbi:hypothetical protein JCM33374_g4051 [Metschnikowia sp. JCM 33374]|nr:hypothetical protein JCM33374_g4051 [Metschnikowia sp. JCM 33374]